MINSKTLILFVHAASMTGQGWSIETNVRWRTVTDTSKKVSGS